MNTYQSMYENGTANKDSLISGINNIASWEDGYWIAKNLISLDDPAVSDSKIIEIIEDTFFMGLSVANRDVFFEANEILIKLYLRYGRYDEAASKLLVLECNYDCPEWVHLYLAMAELQGSTKMRLVDDPGLFFEELLKANINNSSSRKEVQNIFGKYLFFIMEQAPTANNIAIKEMVKFAEKIRFTASDEFRVFHQNVCPDLEYAIIEDNQEFLDTKSNYENQDAEQINALQEKLKESEAAHKKTKDKLAKEKQYSGSIEAELAISQKTNTEIEEKLKKAYEEKKVADAALIQTQKEKEQAQAQLRASNNSNKTTEKELMQEKQAHTITQQQLEVEKAEKEKIKTQLEQEKNEKSEMSLRLEELEKTKQTEMHPESIDDIFLRMTGWLNVTIRRHLAQWLSNNLLRICGNNYWHDNVWKALSPKEKEKFDTYKELSDFAFDALLSIYFYNFDLFYSYNSKAKTDDRDRLKEMQQIRNRWIGHFEENSWTKEKILFDIDTIIGFIGQINIPSNMRKEFRDYRLAVTNMK